MVDLAGSGASGEIYFDPPQTPVAIEAWRDRCTMAEGELMRQEYNDQYGCWPEDSPQ